MYYPAHFHVSALYRTYCILAIKPEYFISVLQRSSFSYLALRAGKKQPTVAGSLNQKSDGT